MPKPVLCFIVPVIFEDVKDDIMVLMITAVLLGMLVLFRPLRRNNFYMLHVGLVAAAAWYLETKYFSGVALPVFLVKWRSVMLIFIVLHLISINLTTFLAYGIDKNAARNGSWRIPEAQLHSLEFLGGWCGAVLGQKIFHHKSKKRSYQSFFWALFVAEAAVIFGILKYLNFI